MSSKGLSLHIGLNEVSPAHYAGWKGTLYGCENDASVYHQISKAAGFTPTLLLTKNATSSALSSFLTSAADTLNAGDMLFISYAGHGGRLKDLNFDETDDDKDETWCLYDRQFVDDELFEAFKKFRAGVRILIFSDSCHSGTASRAPVAEEEELQNDLKEVYKKHQLIERLAPRETLIQTYNANKDEYDKILSRAPVFGNDISTFVMLFAACQDHQTAKEWGDNGLFTASLRKVFTDTINNYKELFHLIKGAVPPSVQTPNLFTYGNAAFDFGEQRPFSLGDSAVSVAINGGKKKSRDMEEERDTDVIVYTNDKPKLEEIPTSERSRSEAADGTVATEPAEKPWDKAYELYMSRKGEVQFAEPDARSRNYKKNPEYERSRDNTNSYLNNWPQPETGANEFIWHLDEQHSQLRKAYERVVEKWKNEPDKMKVRIGHIDTGFLDHLVNPAKLQKDLGVSFVKKERGVNPGKDRLNSGFPAEQDGHGCATMAILAGNEVDIADSYGGYKGFFGAAPFAEVVPIRICETVFNMFNANDVADGIDYAVDNGCEVITMSMAGYPTRRVAEAVNRAYEKGVVIVTAAGNNWAKGIQKITPKAVMYPARFDRVIAATGACYNHEPYDLEANSWFKNRSEGGEFMQGNWGPPRAMKTALAGYTPNLPWATTTSSDFRFFRSGGGTSSATPQVAAAAALWFAYNRDKLGAIEGTWKKAEAARKALFRSANKSYPYYKKYYGNGILRASDALDNFNFDTEIDSLKSADEASVKFLGLFQFIGQWFKGGERSMDAGAESVLDDNIKEMMSLEIAQLLYKARDGEDKELLDYVEVFEFEDEEGGEFLMDESARKKFAAALKRSPHASQFLKSYIDRL